MVHIDGFYPQGISPEEQNGKDVVGTLFENCTFLTVSGSVFLPLATALWWGTAWWKTPIPKGVYCCFIRCSARKEYFHHNNIEKWTGFFPGAVKIFNQTHRVTCRENKIIDHPFSNGVWYDVGNVDGVFVNNRAEKVGTLDKPFLDNMVWPADNAFFFEISKGAVCAVMFFSLRPGADFKQLWCRGLQ